MKKVISISLVISLLTVGAAWAATISFDENGNGTYNTGGSITPLTWGTGTTVNDPGISTLYYDLPFGVTQGDLQITEPSDGTISDVLRFVSDAANPPRVYVYSDHEPGAPDGDLADTAIPQPWKPLGTFPVQVTEIGPEGGWNGVIWQPAPGNSDPGAITAPITYNFTSDVPEPATVGLLGLGALSLVRRKKIITVKNSEQNSHEKVY